MPGPRREALLWGGVWSQGGAWSGGCLVLGDACCQGGGCLLQGGPVLGGLVSQHALRQTPPPGETATADGTHPTGMHSCV